MNCSLAIIMLLVLALCSTAQATELDCENEEIRFMMNSTDFMITYGNTSEGDYSINFSKPLAIVGLVIFSEAIQMVQIFYNESVLNQTYASETSKNLIVFEEPLQIDQAELELVVNEEEENCSVLTVENFLNMIFFGCDILNETTTSDLELSSSMSITTASTITSTVQLPSHKQTLPSIITTTSLLSQTQSMMTNIASSFDDTCSEVIVYAVVVPVIVMLLLNITAFGILLIAICQRRSKKSHYEMHTRDLTTLREVPNESLYAISSFEDIKNHKKIIADSSSNQYTPVFESPSRVIGSSGVDLSNIKRSRPESLPVFAGRQYCEVTPYHASSDCTLPRATTQKEEGIQNQLYQIVDVSPAGGAVDGSSHSVADDSDEQTTNLDHCELHT